MDSKMKPWHNYLAQCICQNVCLRHSTFAQSAQILILFFGVLCHLHLCPCYWFIVCYWLIYNLIIVYTNILSVVGETKDKSILTKYYISWYFNDTSSWLIKRQPLLVGVDVYCSDKCVLQWIEVTAWYCTM